MLRVAIAVAIAVQHEAPATEGEIHLSRGDPRRLGGEVGAADEEVRKVVGERPRLGQPCQGDADLPADGAGGQPRGGVGQQGHEEIGLLDLGDPDGELEGRGVEVEMGGDALGVAKQDPARLVRRPALGPVGDGCLGRRHDVGQRSWEWQDDGLPVAQGGGGSRHALDTQRHDRHAIDGGELRSAAARARPRMACLAPR